MSTSTTASSTNILGTLFELGGLYTVLLSYFPESLHGLVSIVLALLLIYAVYQVLKRNFIFLILLVLLLPQAQPILKSVWENVSQVIQFLIHR